MTSLVSGPTADRRYESPRKWSFADLHVSGLAWVILALSVAVTIAAWHIATRSVLSASETRFSFKTEDIRTAIQKRLFEQQAALWGGVGVFNASNDLTRQEWASYVASLRLDEFLPGLQGYGYAEFVRDADKPAHVARVRAEGFPEFDIRPQGDRALYASIIYLEPFRDRNLRAFGYDMFSEPTRRAALERARDTGEAAISGMVTLVQETDEDVQRGFLMYLPVYRKGMPTSTVAERRAAIQGTVYSPFRMDDLMRGILGREDTEVDFRIYDGASKLTSSLLYDSAGDVPADDTLFTSTTTIRAAGQPWTLEFRSRPGFVSAAEQNQPLFIAAGGILIDILLFLTISALANQQRSAARLASRMTEELRHAKDAAELAATNEIHLRTVTQQANAKLKAANEGLLRFSSIVAHDLRSPLKRIESFIGILQDEYADSLEEEPRDLLVRIDRGSHRMRQMLDALHNYAKYSSVSIRGKTASLACVTENALESVRGDLAGASIEVDVDERLSVAGDAVLLQHVVQNLVSNSLKFRGDSKPTIAIVARRDGAMIELAVEDDGIGIEPEHADKVFDMFARLHNEDEYSGTGIGLAICKKVVGDHNGDIRIDTDREKGTRVVIRLPVAEADQGERPADGRQVAA